MSQDLAHPQLAPAPNSRALAELRTRWPKYLFLLALLFILAALMIYPVLMCISAAFVEKGHLSLTWFREVLSDQVFLMRMGNSLALATVATILCNLIAFPLALLSSRYDFRGKALLSAVVLVPMVLPPFVGAIGTKQVFGKFGAFTCLLQNLGVLSPHDGVSWLTAGGFWVLAALITLSLYPIAYLNLQAALANIDPAMLEAAENLGGKRWTNFRRITLPLAMPGIFAGSTIIFIWGFNELGTPLALDYRNVVSRSIYDDLASVTGGTSSIAFAKVALVLLVSVLAYVVGKLIFGRSAHAMTSKAAVAATSRKLRIFPGLLAAAPFLVVTLLAMLPHIGVVLYSFTAIAIEPASGWGPPDQFGWYRSVIPSRYTLAGYSAIFQTPEIYGTILNSLKYSAVATLIDIGLGIAIAWMLVRTKLFGRTLLDALAMLPLAVPGLVMAFGIIAVLPQLSWLAGRFGITISPKEFIQAPFLILVIAYSMRRLPYMVRSAAGGLQQTSVTLEEAAANMGASPLRVLLKITVPLILANLIAGSMLTFSFAMLEVSDSLILAQLPQSFPITKMIYQLGSDTSGPENVRNACALGVLAMGLLIATIVVAGTLMGKKLGALFRA